MSEVIHQDMTIKLPKIIGNYEIMDNIGSGSVGIVYSVLNVRTNETLACKVVSRDKLKDRDTLESFEQELRIHQSLKHPNIVNIFDVVYLEDHIMIIMELGTQGDLLTYLSSGRCVSTSIFRRVLKDVLKGVSYLHSRNIAHGDIKPENILLGDDYQAKIIDFGSCEIVKGVPSKHSTLTYSAPEILQGNCKDRRKADVWAIGILICVVLSGFFPWASDKDSDLIEEIKAGKLALPSSIPQGAINMIELCTRIDPEERPTINELLKNPWLNGSPVLNKEIKSCNVIRSLKNQGPLIIRPNKKLCQSVKNVSKVFDKANIQESETFPSILGPL